MQIKNKTIFFKKSKLVTIIYAYIYIYIYIYIYVYIYNIIHVIYIHYINILYNV